MYSVARDESAGDESSGMRSADAWVETLKAYLEPEWRDLLEGEWSTKMRDGTWSTSALCGWFLQMYPFIHAFPKFLAEALLKVEDEHSRSFLIDNIRVEKAHAEHWIWMGEGFGLKRAEMIAFAEGERPVLRDVQSLTDWIWFINAKGSLAEAVAATSFAIEGVTGDLTRSLLKSFMEYGSRKGVDMSPKTTKWFRNHAKYDDDHPRIALEVVARYARTERERMKVMAAARRSLQLLNLALMSSCQGYSQTQLVPGPGMSADRRHAQRPIDFPDRRVRDRLQIVPQPA